MYIYYCIYEATHKKNYMMTDDDGRQPMVHLSSLGNITIYNKNMVTTATIELYQPINLYLPRPTHLSINKSIVTPQTIKLSKNKF